MKKFISIFALATLAACGPAPETTPADSGQAVCYTSEPTNGVEPGLCPVAGYVQLIETCDRPVGNPWFRRTDMSCTAAGFAEGIIWCCVGDGAAAQGK